MTLIRQMLGRWGEEQASEFLTSHGFTVLHRNWRCTAGEFDLICQDKQTLVFVEVRTRRDGAFGAPEESVTTAKRRQLRRIAPYYLASHPNALPRIRFDVVLILASDHSPWVVRHLTHLTDAL